MFWHIFKTEIKATVREKSFIFWMMAFPIILGTFFHLAFSNVYDTETLIDTVPAAIVEKTENKAFNEAIKAVSTGDEAILDIEYTDENSALDLLEKGEIEAIVYVDEKISMTVPPNGSNINQTIIKEFLDTYRINEAVITDTMQNNPQKLNDVITALTSEFTGNKNISLTDGNMDAYEAYFFNLIAMVATFGMLTGLFAAISNQANLSYCAMRRCVAPTHKLTAIAASILARFIAQSASVITAITYIKFVLGHELCDNIVLIYLSGIIGTFTAISMGFFIGSIGKLAENIKIGISISVTMILCFFSGLMARDMKIVVEEHFPILNRISPAALICDMYYCLNMYDDYNMYIQKVLSLLIIAVIFIFGGFLLTRRKKYASL